MARSQEWNDEIKDLMNMRDDELYNENVGTDERPLKNHNNYLYDDDGYGSGYPDEDERRNRYDD